MSNLITKKFSIRQTARACGIGRTTLQRLTDCGLIKPAEIGENSYHYYNAKNIYDINTIKLLSECGFTRTELSSLDMSDSSMTSFADELQDKINILTFAMENLRDASLRKPEEAFRIIKLPDLICYSEEIPEAHGFYKMSSFVEKALSEVVTRGIQTNQYYPPFTEVDSDEFMNGNADTHYRLRVMIPLQGKVSGPGIETAPGVTALSVTYKYQPGTSLIYFTMVKNELKARGLSPKGAPRIEALFNPFVNDENSQDNIALRLSIPI